MKTTAPKIVHCIPGDRCRVLPVTKKPNRKTGGTAAPQFPSGIKKILVPIDFSARCKQALGYAQPLAAQYGAAMVLLSATPPLPYEADYGYGMVKREFPDEALIRRTKSKLKLFAKANLPGVGQVDTLVRSGAPATLIVQVARELGIDCIVMCTRGGKTLAVIEDASISEQVIHDAPCPVVVLHEA